MTNSLSGKALPRPQLGATFNDGQQVIEVRAICQTHIVASVTDQDGTADYAIYTRNQFASQFMEGK